MQLPVAGNTALVCMTVYTGLWIRLHKPPYWVDLRVLAKERFQTTGQCKTKSSYQSVYSDLLYPLDKAYFEVVSPFQSQNVTKSISVNPEERFRFVKTPGLFPEVLHGRLHCSGLHTVTHSLHPPSVFCSRLRDLSSRSRNSCLSLAMLSSRLRLWVSSCGRS